MLLQIEMRGPCSPLVSMAVPGGLHQCNLEAEQACDGSVHGHGLYRWKMHACKTFVGRLLGEECACLPFEAHSLLNSVSAPAWLFVDWLG
jgi:hypothetical protein